MVDKIAKRFWVSADLLSVVPQDNVIKHFYCAFEYERGILCSSDCIDVCARVRDFYYQRVTEKMSYMITLISLRSLFFPLAKLNWPKMPIISELWN